MRSAFQSLLIGLVIGLVLIVAQKESKKARLIQNQELAEMIASACGCKK